MAQPANSAPRWTDLKTRAVSAALLALAAFTLVWFGGVFFAALVVLSAILIMKEWEALTQHETPALRAAGYPYIVLPCACMIWLRDINIPSDGALGTKLVFALIAVISATDIGAYFTGRKFGRHKIYPAISPKKSWEGLLGGIVSATFAGMIFAPYMNAPHSFAAALLLSPVIAVIAQAGDFFKSWVKRKAGVKDSGTLLPGHGGLLDRLDGYMFTAPLLALTVYLALKDLMQ